MPSSPPLGGVGPVAATPILAELGDCRRFSSSDDAVRHAGLEVTVYQSDSKRPAGHLSHEGTPVLRWALYEAGQRATRQTSPDHAYLVQVRERTDHKSASLSVARKLCRRAFHILRELGEPALAPVDLDAPVEEAHRTGRDVRFRCELFTGRRADVERLSQATRASRLARCAGARRRRLVRRLLGADPVPYRGSDY
jgi:hypothetical protein